MALTRDFIVFILSAAIILILPCKADHYPPPTGLTYEWLDNFTVRVSWKKPSNLPDDSEIAFLMKNEHEDNSPMCVSGSNITLTFLTEDKGSDHWTYNIWTVGSKNHLSKGTPATITIHTLRPRAQAVEDFKCLIYTDRMNCSWIPANQSLSLMLFYRICGVSEVVKGVKKCEQPYSNGERSGCYLNVSAVRDNICILVETEAGMSSFKPVLVVPPPKLSIGEDGDYLKLSLTPYKVGNADCWTYEICYRQCSNAKECQNASETTMKVPYDKNCRYYFQSRVMNNKECTKVFSDFSAEVHYGTNESRDGILIVVTFAIPIILSICIILSCYCFRRHSAIICPIIPDPSAIFKEMMMTGNKELKTTAGSLYTPVPEPTEPCKITLVTESSVRQQNY